MRWLLVLPVVFLTGERTVWDRVYSEPQALRGEAVYVTSCEKCHQATLLGADQSPALVGSGFVGKWDGLTLGQMHDRIQRTMPPTAPGTLSRSEVSDLIAFLLSVNEFPSGKVDLPPEGDSLAAIRFAAVRPR
jgi:mono/diheme cytochrome c family protein